MVNAEKHRCQTYGILVAILGILAGTTADRVHAQTLKARITVASLSPTRVFVEGECPLTDTWSFRNIYGGITGLGDRIENFRATGVQGQGISVRKLAPGEFRSSEQASKFSYEMEPKERSRLAEMSHVSWLEQERGFLMLADLLPQRGKDKPNSPAAVIEFELPVGWEVASALRPDNNQRYVVSNIDEAVFYLGHSLRQKSERVDSVELLLITSGEWAFADSDALKLAGDVVKAYSKLTKHRPPGRSALMLAPFPGSVGPERWSAETRGSSVMLLLGRNAGRRALLARLGVILTHELFHLWVPNALELAGDYDWFFEGFTLYQALLTARRLDFIRFEDYLDTMARVYDSYRSLPDRDRLSLIEASERRWTTSPSFVYDKGMLVAFIYDLMLRHKSGNRLSVSNVYPQLFSRSAAGRGNANEVIMSLLNEPGGMDQFTERYVSARGEIALQPLLAPYGLKVETTGFQTRIMVAKELNAEQQRMLRSLGYKP